MDLKTKTVKTQPANAQRAFFVSALDMSWQLAIVVLVPVVGGFELDKKLGTTPALTMIGFVTAMVGMFVVLRKILKQFDPGESSK